MRDHKFDAAVRWIAQNDDDATLDPAIIRQQISVLLDVFNHDVNDIVRPILDIRDSDAPSETYGLGN